MSRYISQRTLVTAHVSNELAATLGVTAQESDLVLHAAHLHAHSQLSAFHTLISTNGPALTSATTRLAPRAGADIAQAVQQAAARLHTATADLVVNAAIEAARAPRLGFTHLEVTRQDDVATILATTSDSNSLLMVRVDRQTGQMERDWKVGPGDACIALDQGYVDELAAHGVLTDTIEVDQHAGRRDGARLIHPALALAPDQPTVGAVLDHRQKTVTTGGKTSNTQRRRAAQTRKATA